MITVAECFELKSPLYGTLIRLTIEGPNEYYLKTLEFFGEVEGSLVNDNKLIQKAKKEHVFKEKIDFPFTEHRHNGLFTFLNSIPFQEFSAICEIESSFSSRDCDLLNILIWDDSYWNPIEQISQNDPYCYINFQFWFNWGFFVTGYRLRSSGENFPVNWEIIGITLKGENEEVIDSQVNSKHLLTEYAEKSFRVYHSDFYSSIKFKFTGINTRGVCQFALSAIELFGTLMKII